MSADGEQNLERDQEAAFGAARYHRRWLAVYVVVALSLWLQWLGVGVWIEVRSEDGSEAALAAYLVPLAVLVVGAMWRHPAGRLALVPASFLPGLAMLPAPEWEAMGEPLAMGLSAVTFLIYLLAALKVPAGEGKWEAQELETAEVALSEEADIDRAFHRFVARRVAVVAALGALLVYGVYWSPAVEAALALTEEPGVQRRQHTLVAVAMAFSWMVVVYMTLILPALNWDRHRRGPPEGAKLRALLSRGGALRRRVAIWLILLSAATAAMIFEGVL